MFSKDPSDGDEKITGVRNVCGMRYLYSPRQANGERDWHLDDRLNNVETLLASVWPALANDFIDLSDEHIRKALALFVAITHFRNPEVRKGVEDIHKQLVTFYGAGPQHEDGTPAVDSVEIKGRVHEVDLTDWPSFKNSTEDDHDRFFVELVQSEVMSMAEHLLKKRWSVVLSEADTFITTDRPVVLLHETRERFGFGTEGVILMFPLSPTRLLMMDDLRSEPGCQYYPLIESNAGAFNLHIWREARQFLLTGRLPEEVLAEICQLDTIRAG